MDITLHYIEAEQRLEIKSYNQVKCEEINLEHMQSFMMNYNKFDVKTEDKHICGCLKRDV